MSGAAPTPSRSHDSCTHCGLPVFLAERLLVGTRRALYHRTCFRCARCSAQLTLANCYETEDGSFCCETCPDEEVDKSDTSSQGTGIDLSDSKSESLFNAEAEEKLLRRNTSLSDDEKSSESLLGKASVGVTSSDEYSALFESTVENFNKRKATAQPITGKAPLAISQQMPNDLVCKSDDMSQETLQNTIVNNNSDDLTKQPIFPSGSEKLDQCDELSLCQSTKEGTKPLHNPLAENEETFSGVEKERSVSPTDKENSVHSSHLSSDFTVNQPSINVSTEVSNCTKDSKISSADSPVSSIVKIRKMMFEGETTNSPIVNSNVIRKSSTAFSKPLKEEGTCDVGVNEFPKVQPSKPARAEEEKCEIQSYNDDASSEQPSQFITVEQNVKEIVVNVCSKDENDEECDKQETRATNVNSLEVKSNEDCNEKEKVDNSTSISTVIVKPSVSPRKISLVPKEPQIPQVKNEMEDYPTELNPFGEEEEQEDEKDAGMLKLEQKRKESTNPFGSSDEDEDEPVVLRKKSPEKPPRPPPPLSSLQNSSDTDSFHHCTTGGVPSASPVPAQRRVIPAPASLNPFWSDGEEPEEEGAPTPVPLPRTTIRVTPEPSPRPRTTVGGSAKILSSTGVYGSSSSLSSMVSNTGTHRRSKKPAPAPPMAVHSSSPRMSLPPSPNPSMRSPHKRKSRPAPPPPTVSGVSSDEVAVKSSSLDGRKLQKDEANRSMQAGDKEDLALPRDKSTFGQWKRKKGPAPPRPLPQRRQVRAMPLKELKRELDDIEVKQLELERQGVKLEQTIRHKFDEVPSLNESSMTPDVEDLVIQLFELVNEKNELFRKQAELMYLRRQQRLEEEHAELEYQIRCLMDQPERNKTDIMKAREEELIQRLVEVVERRNEIIECLEMDRIREAQEDQSINSRLGLFAAKNIMDTKESSPSPSKTKKEKKKKKEKESKKKKDSKIDADKDIDEVEAAAVAAEVAKERKSKKKWF